MSTPKLPEPNSNLTQEQALSMILSAIALEEAALAHIMNAEGEKIQHVLNQVRCGDHAASFNHILEVNKSVTNLLEMVQQNQTILKNKMEKALEYLPKPTCLPPLPCPSIPDCITPPDGEPVCFCLVPKVYQHNEPLLWSERNICGDAVSYPSNSSKIQLPAAASLFLGFYAETEDTASYPDMLELVITCKGIKPMRTKIAPGQWLCHPGFFKKLVVEIPRSCTTCHASVFVRIPQGIQIKQGVFFFTRFETDVLRLTEVEQA